MAINLSQLEEGEVVYLYDYFNYIVEKWIRIGDILEKVDNHTIFDDIHIYSGPWAGFELVYLDTMLYPARIQGMPFHFLSEETRMEEVSEKLRLYIYCEILPPITVREVFK